MKYSVVFLCVSLLFFSAAFGEKSNSIDRFNLGPSDADNDYVNETVNLKLRIERFEQLQSLPRESISFSMNKVSKKKLGVKNSYYFVCLAELESKNSKFSFFQNESIKYFGETRNLDCQRENEQSLRDPSILGVRTNFDQGFIVYPFCQSFRIIVSRSN
jgi:hypothetical protein